MIKRLRHRPVVFVLLGLSLCRCPIVRGEGDAGGALMQLEIAPLAKSKPYGTGGILIRELLKQALWMAGHDELGLTVRDAALRETIDPARSAPFVATVEIQGCDQIIVRIARRAETGLKPLFEETIETKVNGCIDYVALVRRCEALARDEFVELLTKEGFAARSEGGDAAARVDVDTETKLRRMDYVSQAAAIRRIHAAEREGGRSPESLAALVIGYANLGHLTDFMSNNSHKVFKARALLYAERLGTSAMPEREAYWHKAYAWALCGRSYEAMFALKAARDGSSGDATSQPASTTQPADSSDAKTPSRAIPPDAPEWVVIIDAYSRSNLDKLLETAEASDPWSPLAWALAYHLVEYVDHSVLPNVVGDKAIAALPGCFRIHDFYNETVGVSRGHQASSEPIARLVTDLPAQLLTIKDLPADVKQVAKALLGEDGSDEAEALVPQLIQTLVRRGDPAKDKGEPSWECFGRMVDENAFAVVQRRASFLKYWLSMPANSFLDSMKPWYETHELANLVETYRLDDARDVQAMRALVRDLSIPEADCSMMRFRPIANHVWRSVVEKEPTYKEAYYRMWENHDVIRGDVARLLRVGTDDATRNRMARWLLYASYYDPAAIVQLIPHDWEYAESRLEKWLEYTGELSPVMLVMGDRCVAVGKMDDALRWYRKAVIKEPSRKAYEGLANFYLQDNDLEGYVATMRDYLEVGLDYGLDHAGAASETAKELMIRREPQRALPFAEAAASSYSQWGLGIAAACYEALGRLDEAHELTRRIADRYPDFGILDWHHFCMRTGAGDLEAARKASRDFIAEYKDAKSAKIQERIAIFHMFEGELDDALRAWQAACESTDVTHYHCRLAAMAHLMGKTDIRDAAIARAHDLGNVSRPANVIHRFRDTIMYEIYGSMERGEVTYPVELFESILPNAGPAESMELLFDAAAFLEGSGQTEKADEYLIRIAKLPYVQNWSGTYARIVLAKRGKRVPSAENRIYSF